MHLAFLALDDPADVRAWSGIPYHALQALRRHPDVDVDVVGPLEMGDRFWGRLRKLYHRAQGRGYLRSHTRAAASALSAAASNAVRRLRPDAVLSLSTLPFYHFAPEMPSASWTDATFEANLLFYPLDYATMSDHLVAEAHHVEASCLRNVPLSFFASSFASKSALGYYGKHNNKVAVIPFGANLQEPPTREQVEQAIDERPVDRCRLLFVGGDWYRKGGDISVRIAEELHRGGIQATLNVAGTTAPVDSPWVRSTGFLRKDVPKERERLRALFMQSHFLCMPARAEDYGCVFPEAGAFGVPSVTTDAGGAPDAVGEGGIVVRSRSTPQEIAEQIADAFSNRAAYRSLAFAARNRYESTTNWDSATRNVLERLRA